MASENRKKTREAFLAFRQARYIEAISLYQELSEEIGASYFKANILLCHHRISKSNGRNDQNLPAQINSTPDLKYGISVIIPSHKGQATIRECLNSLSIQILPRTNFEVIIVLNGEKDKTEDIINIFCKLHPDLKILCTYSPAKGAGAARNLGLRLASFQYTTFIDDDDFVSAGFLRGLLRHASANSVSISNIVDVVDGDFTDSPIDGQIKSQGGKQVSDYSLISSAITLNACKLAPTSLIKQLKYCENLRSGEDVEFWSRLVASFEPIFNCVTPSDDAIYYRRVRAGSVSRQRESFDFNITQRLEVVGEIEKIPTNSKIEPFIDSKVKAQLGFVIRYLQKYPNEWIKFKNIATELLISARATSYVNSAITKRLVISYCFPPFIDTAGIVCAKRIIANSEPADVISNSMESVRTRDENLLRLVAPYLGSSHEIGLHPSFSDWKSIENFCDETIKVTETSKKKYNEIYSRSMWPGSHFAAAALKVRLEKTRWIAEFSDPLRLDIHGIERTAPIRKGWLDENGFNKAIKKYKIEAEASGSLFYWCELLPYVFADEIIFTNRFQKQYMLDMLIDPDLRHAVELKSKILPHPTLPPDYYNISKRTYEMRSDVVNIGYFGSFYPTRGIGDVWQSIELLPNELKGKVKLHIFTPQSGADKNLLHNSGIVINDTVPYLDFLAYCKSFDVLVVNDATTKGKKKVNPYLPSKLSDYLGSGTAIWAIYEEGSELYAICKSGRIKYSSLISDITEGSAIIKTLINRKLKTAY